MIYTCGWLRFGDFVVIINRVAKQEIDALVANDRANLDDVVCNADLYIANQEDFTQGAISQS